MRDIEKYSVDYSEEIDDPFGMLNQIRDVCDNDTNVYLNVPNADSLHRLIATECGLIESPMVFSERNRLLQQNNVFTMESFGKLLEGCGFIVFDKGTFFLKPFTHEQMFRIIRENIIDEKVLVGLNDASKYAPDVGSEMHFVVSKRD